MRSISSDCGWDAAGRIGRGFTLVEILIVVVILGILAAIVVPQFSSAASESRASTLKMDLHRIRSVLEIYRGQHAGRLPTLATFRDQMLLASDQAGQTAAPGTLGYPFGPYLRAIPRNVTNDNDDVTALPPDKSRAWYYNESTGEFRANDSALSRTY